MSPSSWVAWAEPFAPSARPPPPHPLLNATGAGQRRPVVTRRAAAGHLCPCMLLWRPGRLCCHHRCHQVRRPLRHSRVRIRHLPVWILPQCCHRARNIKAGSSCAASHGSGAPSASPSLDPASSSFDPRFVYSLSY